MMMMVMMMEHFFHWKMKWNLFSLSLVKRVISRIAFVSLDVAFFFSSYCCCCFTLTHGSGTFKSYSRERTSTCARWCERRHFSFYFSLSLSLISLEGHHLNCKQFTYNETILVHRAHALAEDLKTTHTPAGTLTHQLSTLIKLIFIHFDTRWGGALSSSSSSSSSCLTHSSMTLDQWVTIVLIQRLRRRRDSGDDGFTFLHGYCNTRSITVNWTNIF